MYGRAKSVMDTLSSYLPSTTNSNIVRLKPTNDTLCPSPSASSATSATSAASAAPVWHQQQPPLDNRQRGPIEFVFPGEVAVGQYPLPNRPQSGGSLLTRVEIVHQSSVNSRRVASSSAGKAKLEPEPLRTTRLQMHKAMNETMTAHTLAHQLDGEILKQYKDAFRIFDRNGDNSISCEELGTVMKSLGHHPSEDELRDMINEVDLDGSGTIEFDEFVAMMSMRLSSRALNAEQELKEAFEVFDRNRDNCITAEELRMVMHNLGENLTDEELSEMMKAADVNGDGVINFNEFQQVWLESCQKEV